MKKGQRLTENQIECMRAYKAEGHTSAEVAAMFGITEKTAQRHCRGISRMDKSTQFQKRTEEEVRDIVKKYNPDLEYVSGYTKGDCIITVQCRKCGNIFQRSMVTVRHGYASKCSICFCIETEKRKQEHQKEIAEKKRIRHDDPLLMQKSFQSQHHSIQETSL